MMTNAEKMAFIRMVADTIFVSKAANSNILTIAITHPNIVGGEQTGRWFTNSETGQMTIRGFDIDINDGVKILKLRFMEQNPDKTDGRGQLKWTANLARKGHRMMWVIDRVKQVDGFLGRLQDGEWIPSQERAYTTVNQQQSAPVPPMENIPDIPVDTGIPEHILRSYAEMEDE